MGQSPFPRNAPAPRRGAVGITSPLARYECPHCSVRHPWALRFVCGIPTMRLYSLALLAGGAEILVSGDEDLLVLADDSPIPTIEPRAFWVLITGGTR